LTAFSYIIIYSAYSSYKGTTCGALLIILFDGDCINIYTNRLIKIHKNSKGWFQAPNSSPPHIHRVSKDGSGGFSISL
jgi:hypothetical protein